MMEGALNVSACLAPFLSISDRLSSNRGEDPGSMNGDIREWSGSWCFCWNYIEICYLFTTLHSTHFHVPYASR